ncbi:hypothetical protein T484DRAFT_1960310, partial [Baffinella frigidus]
MRQRQRRATGGRDARREPVRKREGRGRRVDCSRNSGPRKRAANRPSQQPPRKTPTQS